MRTFIASILLLTSSAATAGAASGTLVLAGDATIAFRFNSGVQSGAANLAGNVTFMQNLLGGGSSVSIFGGPGLPNYTPELVNGFTGIGATVTSFTTSITADRLAGVDLFLAFFPSRDFTADEATVIGDYLRSGGTVFLSGEATTNPFGQPLGALQNARINGLLELLGSGMRLEVGSFDIGDQFATTGNGRVLADPLTAGVASFGYGLTTTVAGGTPLFLASTLQPFVSYETISSGVIPEPATWAMLIAGFGVVGLAARRRRSAIA
ncbi:MAG: PEPxxWA-CTERM sorting domain-containing protein [Sphingomonadaceae bacterium]